MPWQRPSTSAAWMRNSAQWGARRSRVSWVSWRLVGVCQRFMATIQPDALRRQERSMTSLAAPMARTMVSSVSWRNIPSGENKAEVTMTWLAPASSHSRALPAWIPPPSCMPPGQVASASRAASSFPGPSLMMWPPVRPSERNFSANHADDRVETKFSRGPAPSSRRLPPTICFTLPW